MARFEISLHTDYVPGWGVREGVREFIQNAKDGETEHGAVMDVWMTPNGTLHIKNTGATLPRETLLIGYSTKAQSRETLGQFGEGLKLGALALARMNYSITIKNGQELWKPILVPSEKYSANVLAFDITKRKAESGISDLEVEIKGLGQELWDELKKDFLFLNDNYIALSTTKGDLLVNDSYKGALFLKGIFVERRERFTFGYNFKEGNLDRDRKMMNGFDCKWNAARILTEAAIKYEAQRKFLLDRIEKLLQDNAPEIEFLESQIDSNKDKLAELMAARFQATYGEEAVPVKDMAESREMEHFGKQGIVVSRMTEGMLRKEYGSYDDIKGQAMAENQKVYGWHELSQVERSNIDTVIGLMRLVDNDVDLAHFDFVDFGDEKTFGQCVEGRCKIARFVASDLKQLLETMVHEYAHAEGVDGSVNHKNASENMLARIAISAYLGETGYRKAGNE